MTATPTAIDTPDAIRALRLYAPQADRPRPTVIELPRVKPGDVIAFSGRGWIADAINLGTFGIPRWSISHVGIVASPKTIGCDARICEATGKDGVRTRDLTDRVLDYRGRVWLYPLYRRLYLHESERLTRFLLKLNGRPYDRTAFRAAGYLFSLCEAMLHPSSLASLFCSELVAAAHAEVGLLATTVASRWSPNGLVRTERRLGILGKPIRLK